MNGTECLIVEKTGEKDSYARNSKWSGALFVVPLNSVRDRSRRYNQSRLPSPLWLLFIFSKDLSQAVPTAPERWSGLPRVNSSSGK